MRDAIRTGEGAIVRRGAAQRVQAARKASDSLCNESVNISVAAYRKGAERPTAQQRRCGAWRIRLALRRAVARRIRPKHVQAAT